MRVFVIFASIMFAACSSDSTGPQSEGQMAIGRYIRLSINDSIDGNPAVYAHGDPPFETTAALVINPDRSFRMEHVYKRMRSSGVTWDTTRNLGTWAVQGAHSTLTRTDPASTSPFTGELVGARLELMVGANTKWSLVRQ